ncbi:MULTISPECIES: hypothetical protein [Variovorax]|nr:MULTISPECIES: hypothetical protein [unclassified Variovorax]MDM0234900.1 hypothetical protein [Variovorax sp. J2R1-6]
MIDIASRHRIDVSGNEAQLSGEPLVFGHVLTLIRLPYSLVSLRCVAA